jgi:hypothetical protein
MAIDLKAEAYEVSSELFSFKDLRRGVVEHGRVCYIEGYKKHAELFYSFLVQSGYLTSEELHKITTDYDAFINERPAVSILTCEDLIAKKGNVINWSNGKANKVTYLNWCQKDIVCHYVDDLNGGTNILRIKKSRQKGVSVILSAIAYLEAENDKSVLYIGYEEPCKKIGVKKNYKITYEDALLIQTSNYTSNRYDLIIIDEMTTFDKPIEIVEHFKQLLADDGRMIVVGTPLGPKSTCYESCKAFFKTDSADMFTYITGKAEDADKRIEKIPGAKNELYGDFIE